mgnify:CR=1 FL=1
MPDKRLQDYYSHLLDRTEVTGYDVNEFIEKLLPFSNGVSVPLFSAAAITLILCSIRPTLSEDDLTQGLKDISSYITLWIQQNDEISYSAK